VYVPSHEDLRSRCSLSWARSLLNDIGPESRVFGKHMNMDNPPGSVALFSCDMKPLEKKWWSPEIEALLFRGAISDRMRLAAMFGDLQPKMDCINGVWRGGSRRTLVAKSMNNFCWAGLIGLIKVMSLSKIAVMSVWAAPVRAVNLAVLILAPGCGPFPAPGALLPRLA
jgi:hypothetical protein